jgi:hypothetical protein
MHTSVQIVLALLILILLVASLVLFAIQVMNTYSDDENCPWDDSFGEREAQSGPEDDLPHHVSAGGWPFPPVTGQLVRPGGEPSADRIRK